jgi:hypothetical protein
MRRVIAHLKPGSGNRRGLDKPQETQPRMVEIEYEVPVESRTLPAGWTDFDLPMLIGPKNILQNINKDYNVYVLVNPKNCQVNA